MPEEIRFITLTSVVENPWQPREEFAKEGIEELAASIKQHGILQPLVVTQEGGKYQLIAGERRFRAAKLAGLNKVPAIIRDADEQEQLELALIENIQRRDLNAIERAKAYKKLMQEFYLTQEQVAKRVGKGRTAVANALRLLELPEEIKSAVSAGTLTEGHAKVIAGLPRNEQLRFYQHVATQQLSVRETESLGREVNKKQKKKSSPKAVFSDDDLASHYKHLLESSLATKVDIADKSGSGSVTIHYFSEEELRNVVKKIIGEQE